MIADFEYRVLVCGGRDYKKDHLVFAALECVWINSIGILVVIEGGARGADRAACTWAARHEQFGVRHEPYPAKWRENGRYNPGAGPERNTQMLAEGKPDLVVAFPGGSGTRDMIRKARHANVPVIGGEALSELKEAVSAS